MKTALITQDYNNIPVTFTEDGWFNATVVADKFGKRVQDWLDNQETKLYIAALDCFHNHAKERDLDISKNCQLIKSKRGKHGGTWFHPKLAVPFTRWLDVNFAVWCDDQIHQILIGTHPRHNWKLTRHQASASFKVMTDILQLTRERLGKTSSPHHFSNEARLINWALTGEFGKVDRDALTGAELDLLAKLENLNTVLIGCGADYDTRKHELLMFAKEMRSPKIENLRT